MCSQDDNGPATTLNAPPNGKKKNLTPMLLNFNAEDFVLISGWQIGRTPTLLNFHTAIVELGQI